MGLDWFDIAMVFDDVGRPIAPPQTSEMTKATRINAATTAPPMTASAGLLLLVARSHTFSGRSVVIVLLSLVCTEVCGASASASVIGGAGRSRILLLTVSPSLTIPAFGSNSRRAACG